MTRISALGVLLAVAAAACTSSEPADTELPPVTFVSPTREDSSSTTTAEEPSESTEPGTAPATTVDPEPALPQPVMPDPLDILSMSLVDVEGFTSTDAVAPPELDEIDALLGAIFGDFITTFVWDERESEAGDRVFVLAGAPSLDIRGNPALGSFIASTLTRGTVEPQQVELQGRVAWRVDVDGTPWLSYVNNTTAFLATGQAGVAESFIEGLIAAEPTDYLWQPRDCLFLGSPPDGPLTPHAPFGLDVVVACSLAHTFEVIHSEVLGAPASDPYPAELSLQSATVCDEAFHDYVGVYENESRVAMIRYLPDEDEWAEGDRYLACMVTMLGADGLATEQVGMLEGIGETSLLNRVALDCYLGTTVSAPIDCAEPHDVQYIGTAEPVGNEYPFDAVAELDALCSELLGGLGGRGPADEVAQAFALGPGPAQWADGERTVECFATATDRTGTSLLVTGGFHESWQSVGSADEGVAA